MPLPASVPSAPVGSPFASSRVRVTLSLAPKSGLAIATCANGVAAEPALPAAGCVPVMVAGSLRAVASTTTEPAEVGAAYGLDSDRLSVVAVLLPGAASCAVGVKRSAASSPPSAAGAPDTV